MKDPAPKMKDSASITSNMINRNWVLKRKRRKIPSAQEKVNGNKSDSVPLECHANTSPRGKLNNYITSDRSSKKKGNDGYYYECVICDLGGNLLCCDNCPGTYHLQCLDPPLKRIPNGKWQCPNCCLKNKPAESIDNLDPISKRARTKIVLGKSKTGIKSAKTDKISRIFGSSIPGKKESLVRGKSSLPVPSAEVACTVKSSHPCDDCSPQGSSSFSNADSKNKNKLSPIEALEETKSVSPVKSVVSPPRVLEVKTSEETSDSKCGLSGSGQSPGKKDVPILDDMLQGARKRKRKIPLDYDAGLVKGKKLRTDKGKDDAGSSQKRGTKARLACSGKSKPKRKRKEVEQGKFLSKTDEVGQTVDIQLEDKMMLEEDECRSQKFLETGKVVGKSTHADHDLNEVHQVDRVLGCRIQSNQMDSVHHIILSHSNDMPVDSLPNVGNQSGPPENFICDTTSHVEDTEIHVASGKDIVSHVDGATIVHSDKGVEKMSQGKLATNNPWEHNSMDAVEKAINDPDSEVMKDSSEGGSASRPKHLAKLTEQMIMGDNYIAGLSHQDDFKVTQGSEKPISPDIAGNKGLDVEMTINSSNEKKEEAIVAESISSCKGTVSYEFLVKWVGKSHIHNSWVSESQLKVLAKRKLDNYKAKYGIAVINICDERWKLPQRVIALQPSTHGSAEVLVKWTGLPYDECTWEKIDEPVVAKSSHLIDLFNQFEQQTIEKDAAKYNSLKGKGQAQQTDIVTLTEQPKELLGGSLFPHQLEALNWLRKCWYKSKNVILADEMGLGKTVSACAFISSLYFEFKARLPCLVLVPLSTMPNWMAEFSLWAPNLNVVEYHGCARARALIRQYEWHANKPTGSNKKIQSYKFHVLLTTYEMVLADASHLRVVPWEVLVVDEGHRLKNSGSKLFSLLNMFSFQHRVLLTGTPLQNNIGEMYNLLNFLQPDSFPSLASFEENFNDLTTAEKVDELKKLVAPHMLRRLKKDAMQNIPPKTERMVPVELSSIQAEYYRAMLTKNYQVLRNMGKGVPQQSMLNIVMQLRKVCNHPYLIPGTEPESGSSEFLHDMRIKASAKLSLLHSMLKILHREGHRVLIFSQMTKLLDILEDYLNIEFGPKTFERVDGSVSVADRQTAIARFNQDKSRFVFLLSTRSCGLGINLATADTVIIYDSDFNPHADIQAMNRAHRIGQSSRLLVYRLVVRASVEERILQLARKKLMLDQLFVNKSGSQKEVEDILRWGTEELFNDSSINAGKDLGENQSKGDALVDTEHKHKRRTGGLGDVYQDKCTDGNSKIVWDESAILKLLDRSNLHSTLTENAEGDAENDMLGSVKSIEWNEEPTEEQEGNESLPIVTDDISTLNSDKKEEKSDSATEENEWDRLLRVRWVKYQSEEEAALGRGKRQRKAVSYREAYAPNSIETLSENGANEEPEPEPEPEPEREREYTPAGRALKTKFAMLRARQKERLAQRSALKASGSIEVPPGAEPFLLLSSAQDGNQISRMDHPVGGKILAVEAEDMHDQMLELPKSKTEPTVRVGKTPKHKFSSHFNFPIQPFPNQSMDIFLPSQHVQAPSFPNSMPSNNLLPVLGLCAPNATQFEASQRNRSHSRHSRQGIGLEFPFHISPFSGTSNEIDAKGRETVSNKFKMPDAVTETLQRGPKTSILDRLPFSSHTLAPLQGKGAEASENSGDTFSNGYQKLTFPKLPFDESFLPKLPFPGRNHPQPQPDLFPSLSLGSTVADSNNSLQEFPMIPFLPNLKFPKETSIYNQGGREVPPILDLDQMPPKFSAFPENHRKVLENIMMRTGSGSSKLLKKKLVKDTWSEEELDSLWIGVRRHGRGSWDLMLLDPRLKFSKQKTAEDLSARWEEEQLKITEPIQKSSKDTKSGKSSLFPSISDGMMKRALHRSRFAGPMNFHSHLTEMKLGFGDLPSSLQQLEASNKHLPPIPAWHSDRFHTNLMGESSSGPSDRPGTSSNVNTDYPFLLNSFGTTSLNSLGLNGPNSFDGLKFPNIFDNSINMLRESGNSTGSGLAGPSSNKEESIRNLKGGDDLGGGSSSSENKLPHWLRKAVSSAPSAQPPQPELPPTVSAIAQSIRLLYGDENPTIPPFVAPGLPPSPPKDPRCSFLKNKKKKKRKKHKQHTLHDGLPDIPGTSHPLESSNLDGEGYAASTSALASPPLPPPPQLASETSGGPSRIEADLNILPVSPNTLDGSSDVPQLVTSPCINPVPVPGAVSPSRVLEENKEVPLPNSPDQGRKMDSTGNGVSSKTQSDLSMPDRTVEAEISSEGTVSDHPASEDEV